jgi:acyl-CoA thioester hydrolase
LERIGVAPPRLDLWEYGFILGENTCRYRAPVTYPDRLSIGARVSALSEDRFLMEYEARSSQLGKVVAEGDTLVVSYDYAAQRRVPLRNTYRKAIVALEKRDLPPVPRKSERPRNVD